LASLLTGCASISGERTQPITVQTLFDNKEVAGVGCTLNNDAGSWFVSTPGSVVVHKSTGDLAISCKKEVLTGQQTLISKSNGAVWGNIIAGGVVGYVVDRNTGAGFDYPGTVTIALRKVSDQEILPAANPAAPAAGAASAAVAPATMGGAQ
jgi:hypothetical protein